MCKGKTQSSDMEQSNDSDLDSEDSDSDISMTDSSDSDNEESNVTAEVEENASEEEEKVDEDEEDEVITAIKRECNKKAEQPPIILCDVFVTDISYHPLNDILAVGNILGDVVLYKYSNEGNTIANTLELHMKAVRDIEFSQDGKILFSASKDKSIMLSDVETGNLVRFYDNSHEVPVYSLTLIDENMFSTGDDDGTVKLWDLRQKGNQPIYKTKKNEDYISDMITNEAKKYLLCSSGDGSITTIDLENRKIFMQSEEYEEELTCLGLFRSETKALAGSSKGTLYLYNWNEFGLHSDAFPGPKSSINAMIPITENIVVTACEDGNLRATHLFPHRHLGIVGQHDLSVECVDISNNGQLVASTSHNNDIKFWNIQYFENFEKVSHKHKKHEKKKEMQHNLPSSKIKNVSDFFSDLA